MPEQPIRLTQYSRGAGCGCKIAPKILEEIMSSHWTGPDNKRLLVGNDSKDDAAAFDLENGIALISTTDFFMPVVDDAYDFGRIAAANAISDVYAMGGKPLMAVSIFGWPVDVLPVELARSVIRGASDICAEAGIPIAGGHSIDTTEPVFGLAVTGMVKKDHLKRNNTAREGDHIFLTKPIGSGILATAEKRRALLEEHQGRAVSVMTKLNTVGAVLGECSSVTAMTDITGFGLAGHLIEILEGSHVSAEILWKNIPFVCDLKHYVTTRIIPDATYRNWNAYGSKIKFDKGVPVGEAFVLLPDPQTNGGLLFTVEPKGVSEVENILRNAGLADHTRSIGTIIKQEEKILYVK